MKKLLLAPALVLGVATASCGAPDDGPEPAPDSEPVGQVRQVNQDAGGAAVLGSEIAMTQIDVGDLVFDVRTAGPADGEVVILLHGFPQTSYEFRDQLRALGAAGFRAVAPDQRGYSAGARPTGIEAYAIPLLVHKLGGPGLWIVLALGTLVSFMLATEMAFFPALVAFREWREERADVEGVLRSVGRWAGRMFAGLWDFLRGNKTTELLTK